MTIRDAATLKSYFNDGDVPREQEYIDLIDTIFSILPPSNDIIQVGGLNVGGANGATAGQVKTTAEIYENGIRLFSPSNKPAWGDITGKTGYFTFDAAVAYGADQNRNYDSPAWSQTTLVHAATTQRINGVYWDLRNAGSYHVYLSWAANKTQSVNDLCGYIAVGGNGEFYFPFTRPLFVTAGSFFYLSIAKSVATTTWWDQNSPNIANGLWWANEGLWYDNTSYTGYAAPVKLNSQLAYLQ